MVRVFDFSIDSITVKLGIPNESLMERHIEEGVKLVEQNKTEPIPGTAWNERRRRFVADCMNLADSDKKWTADKLKEEFDSGALNAMSNAIYEKCGIKMEAVGEAKAA